MKPTDITKEKGVYIIEEDNNTKCRDKIQLTKDKYCVVRILFFTMGLVHFVPFTFFTTANDYWMYKFRDADNAIYDTSENRTTLQAHFSAAITIATNVPLVAFVLLTTTYGHYVSARKRVYYSIVLMLATFIISTIFIELNTDGWQTEFFILTMILISIINSGRAVYRISIFEIIPKFPSCSVAYFLAGEGLAGIFNSMLQILSLLVGTSTKTSALIYFISGSAVMLFAIGFYNFGERMTYYKAYASTEGYYKKNITFKDIIESSKIIWPSIIIILFLYIAQLTTSPSITSLVKSEASGNVWSETYFVPVITFLLNNVCDFIGRTVGSKVSKVNFLI
ncbi:unnamed protein product [Brassicogethes aeneus]|uniref:Uncharacterized protein n=1 Tax=Brassicogethes aeneus TaxID=1431903 RepID=A0A9P0B1A1_BRAAE|nr:unnamed protein product [Brassicogethes aeneus]